MTPTDGLSKVFDKFMESQLCNYDVVAVEPRYPRSYYGENQKQVPVLKDKCSYCGLSIESPYIQHAECIRIQIELKKEPAPKSKDSATVDVCGLAIKAAWSGIVIPKFHYGEGPIVFESGE